VAKREVEIRPRILPHYFLLRVIQEQTVPHIPEIAADFRF
jgi:hypothetical protein